MDYMKDILPDALKPCRHVALQTAAGVRHVSECCVTFRKWDGEALSNVFGNKQLLDVNHCPAFAELAVMDIFVKDGWDARWVSTYGRGKMSPCFLRYWRDTDYQYQDNIPFYDRQKRAFLESVAVRNGRNYGGCWDIVAWKESVVVFAELKRDRKDAVRTTQTRWLEAAIACGLTEDNFLLVRWDVEP